MRWAERKNNNQKGFVLIGMLFLMILIAVTAVALNRRAGLQAKMSAGRDRAVQTRFDQAAAVADAVWELTQNPFWRTDAAGVDYNYNGTAYNRKVLSSTVSGLTDAVTIAVAAPSGSRLLRSAFRYYIYPPIAVQQADKAAYKVCRDASNNLYFAVPDKHIVYRRNDSNQEIIEVAGNSTSGYSGDSAAAVDAQLNKPYGVFVDATGNIFIADTGNHCIRKVDTSGNISTVAGTGVEGYTGDGAAAISAQLNAPKGVFVDAASNIYVADTGNHCVRKFVVGGNIDTIAGTGTAGFSGDGAAATAAELNAPHAVFVDDAGNAYIADTLNHCIRKVDTSGDISTAAGQGTSQGFGGDGGLPTDALLNAPQDLWVTTVGINRRIYIADTGNHRIRYIDTAPTISTIAGSGDAGYSGDGAAAVAAMLDSPAGICLDTTLDPIFSDANNACLRKVDLSGGNISSLFAASELVVNSARDVVLDASGNLYIADAENHRVRKLDTAGNVTTIAGNGYAGFSGDGSEAVNAKLNTPKGVALDDDGNIYIADTLNHCIRKVDTSGDIDTVAGQGTSSGFSGDGGGAVSAELNTPEGVYIKNLGGPNVIIYIADTGNHCIREVSSSDNISTVAGQGTSSGYSGDGGPATSALLNAPQGVFEITGEIYIADTGNHCIRKLDASENISTIAGIGTQSGATGDGGAAVSAKLDSPGNVFVDASGNLFIADSGNEKVRIVSALDDIIRTLAGNGSQGFNGEDQPAVQAQLDQPSGIAMAAVRGGLQIYISDTENNRIRILSFEKVSEFY